MPRIAYSTAPGFQEILSTCIPNLSTIACSTLDSRLAGSLECSAKEITRRVFFTDSRGQRHTCEAIDGESILNIAKSYNLDIEGACLGECACSTCHVIVTSKSYYDVMDSSTEREEDMLDLAFGLTLSSRLGCQIYVKPALDGIEFKLPGIEREKLGSL